MIHNDDATRQADRRWLSIISGVYLDYLCDNIRNNGIVTGAPQKFETIVNYLHTVQLNQIYSVEQKEVNLMTLETPLTIPHWEKLVGLKQNLSIIHIPISQSQRGSNAALRQTIIRE